MATNKSFRSWSFLLFRMYTIQCHHTTLFFKIDYFLFCYEIDEESAASAISPVSSTSSLVGQHSGYAGQRVFATNTSPQHTFNGSGGGVTSVVSTVAMSTAGSITPVTPVVSASQLSPISPTLPAQMSQPYTADVCQYGPIYNAYNYATAAGKMRTSSPYGRNPSSGGSVYQPPYHPHQNPFPNAPFYSRAVQNPFDYSPR